ncbi:hypothetical protein KR222_005068, partial [Zaprionus bogoriensis]
VNKILTPMLGKLSKPIEQADWYKLLSKVEFAINNSIHSITQKSPSMLLFGVPQMGPIVDELTEYIEEKFNLEQQDLGTIRSDANKNILQSQYYKKKHKAPLEYKVGDFVAIRNIDTTPGINKKFAPKYRGPYKV